MGTCELAEEMELSLEQYIKAQASSKVDENASSTSLIIPDSAASKKNASERLHAFGPGPLQM